VSKGTAADPWAGLRREITRQTATDASMVAEHELGESPSRRRATLTQPLTVRNPDFHRASLIAWLIFASINGFASGMRLAGTVLHRRESLLPHINGTVSVVPWQMVGDRCKGPTPKSRRTSFGRTIDSHGCTASDLAQGSQGDARSGGTPSPILVWAPELHPFDLDGAVPLSRSPTAPTQVLWRKGRLRATVAPIRRDLGIVISRPFRSQFIGR
jgi:hypothetical protein